MQFNMACVWVIHRVANAFQARFSARFFASPFAALLATRSKKYETKWKFMAHLVWAVRLAAECEQSFNWIRLLKVYASKLADARKPELSVANWLLHVCAGPLFSQSSITSLQHCQSDSLIYSFVLAQKLNDACQLINNERPKQKVIWKTIPTYF